MFPRTPLVRNPTDKKPLRVEDEVWSSYTPWWTLDTPRVACGRARARRDRRARFWFLRVAHAHAVVLSANGHHVGCGMWAAALAASAGAGSAAPTGALASHPTSRTAPWLMPIPMRSRVSVPAISPVIFDINRGGRTGFWCVCTEMARPPIPSPLAKPTSQLSCWQLPFSFSFLLPRAPLDVPSGCPSAHCALLHDTQSYSCTTNATDSILLTQVRFC